MQEISSLSKDTQSSTHNTMLLSKAQQLGRKANTAFIALMLFLSLSQHANAQIGNAIQCSGGYATATGIDISNSSFTIEFWMKATANGYFNIAIGQGSTANNHGLHIGFNGSNQFVFNYYNSDFTYTTATDNNWHHWACVNDGTTTIRKIYKDGVLVATSSASSNFLGTGTFYLGRSSFGGGFSGTLDGMRVWSVARTQSEIQNNKDIDLSSGTGLLASYSCNQGIANGNNSGITALTDATGTYNATLNNFGLNGTTNNFVNGLPTTYTFNGTTNSDWATASNWSSGIVPTTAYSGDVIIIAANCTMNDVTFNLPTEATMSINNGITLSPSLNTYITIASGATFTLNPSASMTQGRFTNNGTMDIYGSYTAFYMTNNSGGVLNILSGGSYSCPACAESFQVGGTINNAGTMHAGTQSTWQGTINNNTGGIITDGGNGAQIQLGASSTLHNYGSFISRTAGTAGIFNNYATGSLTMPGTCNFTIKNGGNFSNVGNLTAGNADNFLNVQAGGTLTNTGTMTINGSMVVSAGGTFSNTGTYKGSGGYTTGLFTNPSNGIVAPGNSAGCSSFANGFTNDGTVQIELGGTTACTQHDKINVTGTATLGGTLTVTLINGYVGTGSDQATILSGTAVSGTFSSVSLPANWYINYTSTAVILSYNSVLPVELVRFTGRETEGGVLLEWQTASERNNEGFFVERLTGDGGVWSELGFVAGHGTTTKAEQYGFYDEKPLPGVNYYRLRQMDFDGREDFSKVISVEMTTLEAWSFLKLFPNPVSGGELTVLLPDHLEEGITAHIFSPTGQLVRSANLSGSINTVDVSGLAAGVYYLRMKHGKGVYRSQLLTISGN